MTFLFLPVVLTRMVVSFTMHDFIHLFFSQFINRSVNSGTNVNRASFHPSFRKESNFGMGLSAAIPKPKK